MGGISSSWRRQDNEMENLEKQQTTKTDQQGIQRIEKAVEPNSLGLNPTLLISCVILGKLCNLSESVSSLKNGDKNTTYFTG